MSFIIAIIVGFFAGLIARALHPGNDKGGFIFTTLLGIGGSVVATYIGRYMGWYAENSSAGFVASIIGAIVVLMIYNLITRRAS
ncbi:GlsB/YeaQ/YmgE family stress response membrane protein [Acinetobacter larvae]|uniref:Transglycosylase n=1 Tax=Acinetobacter larvae TaxID=1789224 RepID=A0A1B2M3Q2_9GAMM|nr:GlsB/YeaQ/YmgE family stress response membrane protein [Acinetobacter larvae]AOA59782.1 transglycosylase [Acinetobacter larvae]